MIYHIISVVDQVSNNNKVLGLVENIDIIQANDMNNINMGDVIDVVTCTVVDIKYLNVY